jgi:hypothetical protein
MMVAALVFILLGILINTEKCIFLIAGYTPQKKNRKTGY